MINGKLLELFLWLSNWTHAGSAKFEEFDEVESSSLFSPETVKLICNQIPIIPHNIHETENILVCRSEWLSSETAIDLTVFSFGVGTEQLKVIRKMSTKK